MHPFLPYDNDKFLIDELADVLKDKGIKKQEIRHAVRKARREDEQFPVFAWIALALLIASVLLLNRKNPWLAKKNFFKRKVKDNNEE